MRNARPIVRWSDDKRDAVQKHYPLVCAVARNLSTRIRKADIDDLIQDGAFGLADAIDKFDPAKSSFKTFATWRIRGAMLDGIRARDWVPRVVRTRKQHAVGMADFSTMLALAQRDEQFPNSVPKVLLTADPHSQRPFDILDSIDLQTSGPALRLTPRRRQVMALMYREGLNTVETARRLGLSQSAISVMHREILKRLRRWADRQSNNPA